MPSKRVIRVCGVIKEEISTLISRSKDFEGHIITVADVEMTPDLRKAFIYISMIEDDETVIKATVTQLNKNRKEWQAVLNKRLKLKFTPHLLFEYDGSIQRGDRVMEILQEIKGEYENDDEDNPEDSLTQDAPPAER